MTIRPWKTALTHPLRSLFRRFIREILNEELEGKPVDLPVPPPDHILLAARAAGGTVERVVTPRDGLVYKIHLTPPRPEAAVSNPQLPDKTL